MNFPPVPFSLLLAPALVATLLSPALAVERAMVLHGGDRTLASVVAPAGPVTLNLASVGLFPSEMVRFGQHAWVPCGGSDRVDVVDLAGDLNPDPPAIVTGPGTNPYGVAFAGASKIYVSLLTSNAVAVANPLSGGVAATIPVGRSPQGVLFAAGRIFVANTGFDFSTFGYDPGTVSVIDPATDAVIATLPVGTNPQALALAPNGEVHVICTGNYFSEFGRVFVIDPNVPAVVADFAVGGSPGFIAISPAGTGYVSDYFLGLLSYDVATRTLLHGDGDPIAVGTGAAGVDFDTAGRVYAAVYGDDQVVVLGADDSILNVHPLGDGPQDVVLYDSDEPVAVALADFAAALDGGDVTLSWRTQGETDHAAFQVERSAVSVDGPWGEAGRVTSGGADHGRYSFVDRAPFDGSTERLWYRLVAIDRDGGAQAFAPAVVERPATGAIAGLALGAPAPNPLRSGVTRLALHLAFESRVVLTVHDPAGREVARPLESLLSAGDHAVTWDGHAADGRELARGVYFL
ncbi:MAG TPA: FlgD immunoglobulin-like domain containing protein, partial [Candidatus Eisenbacteria bacterium]